MLNAHKAGRRTAAICVVLAAALVIGASGAAEAARPRVPETTAVGCETDLEDIEQGPMGMKFAHDVADKVRVPLSMIKGYYDALGWTYTNQYPAITVIGNQPAWAQAVQSSICYLKNDNFADDSVHLVGIVRVENYGSVSSLLKEEYSYVLMDRRVSPSRVIVVGLSNGASNREVRTAVATAWPTNATSPCYQRQMCWVNNGTPELFIAASFSSYVKIQ